MAVWKSRRPDEEQTLLPRFTRSRMVEVPRDRIPDHVMLPQTAYQIVCDEVMLDGNARFNLATFVTTWMDEEADRLYTATADKNMIDKDEYPQTAEIEARCVRMLGDLCGSRFHDLGCGVRVMRRQVLADMPLDGEFGRFFPLLAYYHGFAVEEVPVPQHPANHAARVHGPGIYLRRLLTCPTFIQLRNGIDHFLHKTNVMDC